MALLLEVFSQSPRIHSHPARLFLSLIINCCRTHILVSCDSPADEPLSRLEGRLTCLEISTYSVLILVSVHCKMVLQMHQRSNSYSSQTDIGPCPTLFCLELLCLGFPNQVHYSNGSYLFR
uniref:Uncharacterized protein n=1 Tax=Arundo donax TaxID=35708 RepID=A0A0A9DF44_ARUDO